MRCSGRLLAGDRAEDVVQRTFIRVYEAITDGHAPASLRPSFFRVVHNCRARLPQGRVLCVAVLVGLSLTGAGGPAHAAFPGGNGKIACGGPKDRPAPDPDDVEVFEARRAVARGTASVSKWCTYKKRITIRTAKRTGRRKARLRVSARFGGNASLSGSGRSTTVRIF